MNGRPTTNLVKVLSYNYTMHSKVPHYITYPLIMSIAGPLIWALPFVGPIIFLPFIYMMELYDYILPGSYLTNDEHFEIGFLGSLANSFEGWLFLISFFFLLGILLALFKLLLRKIFNTDVHFLGAYIFFSIFWFSLVILYSVIA